LIVAWSYDVGGMAPRVIDFLDKKLGLEGFGEIKPEGFFSLDGVRVEEDVIQFPESEFYSCQKRNILIFESDIPNREHYKFLNTVLDFAVDRCKVKEIYTIGGIVSSIPHLSPRRVSGVVNRPELKRKLARYGVSTNVDYQTPPGGRPTLNSFLLWVAKRRDIAGCGLWVEVPFYLAATEDPLAAKHVLTFLDRRFNLSLDLGELDLEIEKLNKDIEELKRQNPDITRYIERLERGITLSESEGETLAREVVEFLQKRG
jgi:proteasome assembly chaperone (PAC2) family protein